MIFERQGKRAIPNPTSKQLSSELRRLRSTGPSAFACLPLDDGSYLQVAGGGGGMLLERRDGATKRHFRGFQDPPVVPFEGDTELRFAGMTMVLRPGDWFRMDQIIELFQGAATGKPLPNYVGWRKLNLDHARPVS